MAEEENSDMETVDAETEYQQLRREQATPPLRLQPASTLPRCNYRNDQQLRRAETTPPANAEQGPKATYGP